MRISTLTFQHVVVRERDHVGNITNSNNQSQGSQRPSQPLTASQPVIIGRDLLFSGGGVLDSVISQSCRGVVLFEFGLVNCHFLLGTTVLPQKLK